MRIINSQTDWQLHVLFESVVILMYTSIWDIWDIWDWLLFTPNHGSHGLSFLLKTPRRVSLVISMWSRSDGRSAQLENRMTRPARTSMNQPGFCLSRPSDLAFTPSLLLPFSPHFPCKWVFLQILSKIIPVGKFLACLPHIDGFQHVSKLLGAFQWSEEQPTFAARVAPAAALSWYTCLFHNIMWPLKTRAAIFSFIVWWFIMISSDQVGTEHEIINYKQIISFVYNPQSRRK